ncbi:MAG: ATP-binding protein [Deltaproteobacteria bacterium]|nr:ATP-binding protein [Deltaproteobacteria bacterium]
MSRTLNTKLLRNAEETMNITKAFISHVLIEPEASLNFIAANIEGLYNRGEGFDAIKAYMAECSTPKFKENTRIFSYSSMFGYFDVIEEFYDGGGWRPTEGYLPKERLWYKAAMAANGKVGITSPYIDADTLKPVIAYARRIYDEAGNHIGVVCVDVHIDYFRRLIIDKSITPGSYGFVVDEDLKVIIHPNHEIQGEILGEYNPAMRQFAGAMLSGSDISLQSITNYAGVNSLVFGRRLDNGWFLAIVVPKREYYKDLYDMMLITSVLGFIAAAALMIMLVHLEKIKKKSDRRMTARIEAIIDNLTGMAYQRIYNPPLYNFTFVSKGSTELMGYTPEELIGADRYYAMLHPEDAAGVMEKDAATLPFDMVFEHNYRIITRDGAVKWIWERCRTLEKNPDGTPRLIEGYCFDITERWKLETAELANRSKSKFLAIMSHEIRTPMNSIMGFAELALDKAREPQLKDYLVKISDSAKWLLHIVDDILDISKIESGKMELENLPFDLCDIISRCQSVILPNVKEKNLELKIFVEPLIGKKPLGDPLRLYQVLLNLLSNAVKFTHAGSVTFSALVKSTDDNSAAIYFEVKDSGIGMSPEQVEKIFAPFIQADSSTTRNYGGTGLGLAIAKNIIDLMGGELVVQSSPRVGSTFSFEIVFATMEALDDDKPDHLRFDILEKPRFDGLVLVCDDNTLNQELICEHLARVGLRTVLAENGKAGLETVQERIQKGEKPFDLIFMDMFMPVMDGMEAASAIAALNTKIPIVAMTANVMEGDLERYRRNGMPDCLGKPFKSQELWRVLLKYLTPVDGPIESENERTRENVELHKKLLVKFAKDNQARYAEIAAAIAAGETALAHRLAHTLKGNAGQIGQKGLQNAAQEIEALLQDKAAPVSEDSLELLKTELELVLDELKPLFDEPGPREGFKPMNREQVLALFEKLEPMLENINPKCLDLLDDIRVVEGAEELASQMEDYEFEAAAKTLAELKKQWA